MRQQIINLLQSECKEKLTDYRRKQFEKQLKYQKEEIEWQKEDGIDAKEDLAIEAVCEAILETCLMPYSFELKKKIEAITGFRHGVLLS